MGDSYEFLEKMLDNASLIIGSSRFNLGDSLTRGKPLVKRLVKTSNQLDDVGVHLRKHPYVHGLKWPDWLSVLCRKIPKVRSDFRIPEDTGRLQLTTLKWMANSSFWSPGTEALVAWSNHISQNPKAWSDRLTGCKACRTPSTASALEVAFTLQRISAKA